MVTSASGIRGYVNFIQGDHGSIIDFKVPAVTYEMQGEMISFALSNGEEIAITTTTPSTVIQP